MSASMLLCSKCIKDMIGSADQDSIPVPAKKKISMVKSDED
jgi:hypothetical protein